MIRQAPAPNVTIAAYGDRHGHRLALIGADDVDPLILEVREEGVLRQHGARFAQTVARVLALWQRGGRIPLADTARSLQELAAAGRILLTRSLRNAREVYDELGTRMDGWCPLWRDGEATVPVLHVQHGAPQWLPWELLPLFDLTWSGGIEDDSQLWRAARAFPGLSAVVERGMEQSAGHALGLRAPDGRLPLRYLWHALYPGARGELGFFRSRPGIRLDGPHPGGEDRYPGAVSFAEQLVDPGLGIDGQRLPHPHQVLHMSCHTTVAVGDDKSDDPLVFHLASESGQAVDVSVERVLAELMPAWARTPRHGKPGMPLVFLNACSTAARDPLSLGSLLEPFEYNRNPGVIGTVAKLPDRLAEAFSRRFYEALLVGHTAGESLHTAKWDLLHTRRNPVGLLYALHGDSTLQMYPLPVGVP
ncbi:CHAT domain-containing protein [Streptomyces europaeiscabiei]|uniref:CHAT domain-containing protein n=1 Tax=Streptomyces europaeiscabiei TaxID=146819 RepID=UPI0029B121BD|nr:CHAT domain-containing protein [Streptomyces europaeiscabiei]MDX3611293.1 CHAT domain-containing protein [Streptomyces europaeiscabiei]